eukprot:scaffold2504_cov405-Prasinococcus_capsulatus_cf.AAC.8
MVTVVLGRGGRGMRASTLTTDDMRTPRRSPGPPQRSRGGACQSEHGVLRVRAHKYDAVRVQRTPVE